MVLIMERILSEGISSPPEEAENFYLTIPKLYLSTYYDLPNETRINGKILDINRAYGDLSENEKILKKDLPGKEIEFVLKILYLGSDDNLYISRNSWNYFKDYGIFPGLFTLKVILSSATFDSETIQLFPKREVIA